MNDKRKIGRNEPCPCGSGKKYKKCHGVSSQITPLSLLNPLSDPDIQKKIAEDEVKYAKGSYWPTISLEGEYFRQENEPSSSFGLEERIYGGLKLDFPFFEGGLRRAEVREAKARLRQAEYSLSDLRHEVSVEVENSYLFLKREAAILKQVQAELAFAQENFKSVTKQFQHGIADSIDTIDANTLLVTAERGLANAKYTYQLAILNLKRATGILLRTVLGQQQDKKDNSRGEQ